MSLVNDQTTVVQGGTLPTISAISLSDNTDAVILYQGNSQGVHRLLMGQLKAWVLSFASGGGGGGGGNITVVSNLTPSGWLSDVQFITPSANAVRKYIYVLGSDILASATWVSNGSNWFYHGGHRTHFTNPNGSLTPFGIGERVIVRNADNYGNVTLSSTWVAFGPLSTHWGQQS
jgi:hypothetical protein